MKPCEMDYPYPYYYQARQPRAVLRKGDSVGMVGQRDVMRVIEILHDETVVVEWFSGGARYRGRFEAWRLRKCSESISGTSLA